MFLRNSNIKETTREHIMKTFESRTIRHSRCDCYHFFITVTKLAALREEGIPASLINSRFAKPLDTQMLMEAASKHTLVVTMEENVINGGFGEHITRFYNEHGIYVNVLNIAIPDEYVEHGNVDILYHEVGIDADTILKRIKEVYHPL